MKLFNHQKKRIMKTRAKRILVVAMICCGISLSMLAQVIEVSGKVFESKSKTVIVGATILVKGGNTGTITSTDGTYKIKTEIGKTLIFKSIGCNTKKIKVTNSLHDVYLEDDTTSLNEVVVVAYGCQKRSTVCGSVSSFSGHHQSISVADCKASNFTYSQLKEDVEEYSTYKENRFFTANDQPLSTFSLDVDAASYSNMRRMVNQGQIPPKDAIRIEELINYFSYKYDAPTGDNPVNIVTESATCPWNEKHKLVRIGVKAKEIPSENLPASNFVFLLDVSGSMQSPNKLELVKSSLKLLSNNLRSKDRVAIVVYAGAAGVVLESTAGNDRPKIIEAIEKLTAGGSTAGGAGIELAYKIAEKNFISNGNNRIVLCTDGDFNVGVSNPAELENLIESKRKTGVFLTVLGYGMGNYKDNKLQTLSEKGNGNHAYIDNLQEANKVLVNEFGSTMYTVAKDVKLQIEFNPAYVNAYRLIGYESRLLNKEDFNDDTKDAGELGSGHTVTALYEIIPVGVKNTFGGVDDLKYQKQKSSTDSPKLNNNSGEILTVKLRYKLPSENISKKMEVPVYVEKSNVTASSDFQFVMAIAMFGQILKNSDFKGNATYQTVLDYAKNGIGTDIHGYRKEFIRLVESVDQLVK
jgi:Ca-activated chloride channel family protein